jgi:hypothetical protein
VRHRRAAAPERIGRFEIKGVLGRGGFGIVLLAHDPNLQRPIALKLPRPEILVTPDQRRRFIQEAQTAGQLEHPNIVPIFEAGDVNGVLYIASAYCPGGDLAAWLRRARGPLEVRLAARIVATLADAVHEAHRQGIIHRDLKPSNVLLARTRTDIRPDTLPCLLRITDFGLSKILEGQMAETGSSMLLGTPQYMSPEQAEGHGTDSTPQTDIYSLGVMLYELLAGAPLFGEAAGAQLLRRIVDDEPAPLARVRRDVPRDLAAICARCLEKSPAQRYGTAADLRDDLQRFLDGQPVVARPVSPLKRTVRWCRRRPAQAALLAVVVIAILGATAGTWLYLDRLQTALVREEALRKQAERFHAASERDKHVAEERGTDLRRQLFCLDARAAWRSLALGNSANAQMLLQKYADDSAVTSTFVWRYLSRMCRLEERVWNLGSQVYWITFSPDGRRVAAGVEAGFAIMWDVETGDELFRLAGHTSCVNVVRFTPDGQRLWTASCDGTIRLWDAANGHLLKCSPTAARGSRRSLCP